MPQVSIAQTYLKIMIKFCEQFGLTPSSRSRIDEEKGSNDYLEPIEIMLSGEIKQCVVKNIN